MEFRGDDIKAKSAKSKMRIEADFERRIKTYGSCYEKPKILPILTPRAVTKTLDPIFELKTRFCVFHTPLTVSKTSILPLNPIERS